MSASPIAPGVYRVTAGAVGLFLIDVPEGVVVIDAGFPGNVDRIMSGIKSIGRIPTDVNDILITHYHNDHVGSLGPLADAARAKVWVPKGDATLIREGGRPPEMEHRGLLGVVVSRFTKMPDVSPHRVDEEVSGGDELPLAGGIQVIAAPGHTPGHVCYLWPQHGGVLFVGDAAANFLGKLDVMPIGEDFPTAEKSLVALGTHEFNSVGFGHGKSITSRASETWRRAAQKYAG